MQGGGSGVCASEGDLGVEGWWGVYSENVDNYRWVDINRKLEIVLWGDGGCVGA